MDIFKQTKKIPEVKDFPDHEGKYRYNRFIN